MSLKSDASTKILGFKYQEMVALKECLEGRDGTKIYLECLGDVSDGKKSIEVKHSINDNKKLIDTHVDFWKTLSNILEEYDTLRFYNKFILHTTAEIKKGSIFENWNNLSKLDKVLKISTVKSNVTINAYLNKVKSFDKSNLKDILDKFEIKDKQESAKEYYERVLLKHSAIKSLIKEKDREAFICCLLGYISNELIKSTNYVWSIDIDSFHENYQSYAVQYQIDDLKFPVSENIIDSPKKNSFFFVKALETIDYRKKIGRSMNNYLKASESQVKMIQARTSLIENLDNYDDDIREIVLELKDSHIDKLIKGCDTKEKSRRFFDDSLEKVSIKTKIQGVTDTLTYYPKGRLLHNIEIKSINLNLGQEDESN